MLTRRRMMVGGVGIVAAGVAGAIGVAVARDRYGFIGTILRRNLPGVLLSDAEIRKFVDAYWPEFVAAPRRREAAMRQLAVLVQAVVPSAIVISEETERLILTEFLMGSNFFQLSDPRSTAVEFLALAGACPNPWYRT